MSFRVGYLKFPALVFMGTLLAVQAALGAGRSNVEHIGPRGIMGFEILGGAQYPRLLNTDGSYSTFNGYLAGAQLVMNFLGTGTHRISPFGKYLTGTSKDTVSSAELNRASFEAGLLIGMGSNFFLGVSYGWENLKYKSGQTPDTNLSVRTFGAGLGLSIWSITPSLDLTMQGWYRIGTLPKKENSDLSTNSAFDTFDVLLGIRWTPAFSWDSPEY